MSQIRRLVCQPKLASRRLHGAPAPGGLAGVCWEDSGPCGDPSRTHPLDGHGLLTPKQGSAPHRGEWRAWLFNINVWNSHMLGTQ